MFHCFNKHIFHLDIGRNLWVCEPDSTKFVRVNTGDDLFRLNLIYFKKGIDGLCYYYYGCTRKIHESNNTFNNDICISKCGSLLNPNIINYNISYENNSSECKYYSIFRDCIKFEKNNRTEIIYFNSPPMLPLSSINKVICDNEFIVLVGNNCVYRINLDAYFMDSVCNYAIT